MPGIRGKKKRRMQKVEGKKFALLIPVNVTRNELVNIRAELDTVLDDWEGWFDTEADKQQEDDESEYELEKATFAFGGPQR